MCDKMAIPIIQSTNNRSDQSMDAFLIIVAIVAAAIFLVVDLYLMAIYSHKEESNLSFVNVFCKILIILTLLQIQFQPLFLIIDVVNSRDSTTDLTVFWVVLYCSILVNIAFLKPLATSLYQRDHDEPCWKNFLWIIIEMVVTMGVFGCFVGVGWIFFGYVYLPVTQMSLSYQNVGMNSANASIESAFQIKFQSSVPCFIIALFCLLGYPILSCCGACGMTALPISLILEFVNRPQFRRTADARKVVAFLKEQTVRLLKESQRLKRTNQIVEEGTEGLFNFRKRWNKNNNFEKELASIESEMEMQKDYYELFKMELQMQKVNPVVFFLKLILGILCIFAAIIVWVQILLAQLVFSPDNGYKSVFLDRLFQFMESQNANFVGVAFLMLIALFLTSSIIKGAIFFSNSLPFITIHPIIEGKTWLNSYLFHLVLCVLSSCSLIHMMIKMFPYYLRGGQISLIMTDILENMYFVGVVIRKKIFCYAFLAIGFLGFIYVMYKMVCANDSKGDLLKRIEAKRLKLFGKQNQNKSLKYIEMTDLNVNKIDQKGQIREDVKDRDPKKKITKKSQQKNSKVKLVPL